MYFYTQTKPERRSEKKNRRTNTNIQISDTNGVFQNREEWKRGYKFFFIFSTFLATLQ